MESVKVKRSKAKIIKLMIALIVVSILAIVFLSGDMIVSRGLFGDKTGILAICNNAYKASSEKSYYDFYITKSSTTNTTNSHFECYFKAVKKENGDIIESFKTSTWTSDNTTKTTTEFQYERTNNIGHLYNKTSKTVSTASIIGSLIPATGDQTTSSIQLMGLHRLFDYTEAKPADINSYIYKTYSCASLMPAYIGAEVLLGEKNYYSKLVIDTKHNIRRIDTSIEIGNSSDFTKMKYSVKINDTSGFSISPISETEKTEYSIV